MTSRNERVGDGRSNVDAPTRFVEAGSERYAYRRFGGGEGLPLLCLQHFKGTLDNWDPAVTDALARKREVILFDSAGIGCSIGVVPRTIAGMARHALAFLDALDIQACDVLGYSLGGMIAQQISLDRPTIFRRMILAGTAPRGGDDIMHLDKPTLAAHLRDPSLQGFAVLQKIFFTSSEDSQKAGAAFIARLDLRKRDREPPAGRAVASAQIDAFREWEQYSNDRFSELRRIAQPVFIVNGVRDEMIPVVNSYYLAENIPKAFLLTYPDAGHGAIFQYHESFVRHVEMFLTA